MTDDVGPIISSRGGSDPAREVAAHYRVPKGFARLIVEVSADIATAAEKRARRRRVPLGRVVEDALRAALTAEGLAVMLAALAIAVSGCHASAETKRTGCTMPAELPCRFD